MSPVSDVREYEPPNAYYKLGRSRWQRAKDVIIWIGSVLLVSGLLVVGYFGYQKWQAWTRTWNAIVIVLDYNLKTGKLDTPPQLGQPAPVTTPPQPQK